MADSYRVSVVCWGNICRSAMAEHMLREAAADSDLADRLTVDSYGTSTEELGNGMDRRAVAALHRNGSRDTGWSTHRARQFLADDFDDHDLVLAADHVHERILRERARDDTDLAKVVLLRSFDPAALDAGDLRMADPWYGDDTDFDQTYRQIAAAIPGILERVRADLTERAR
ncbi:low molecular weight protein-tyrosine-phosphatase [Cumulibacter manganitolerans]|uniref:low molecular weight protein-tyrosine-phosphatase n=1 Tax=Cumulibacter manganitolerans TaxID=1884992 RepID=UPI001296011B|nr:low molecular weight protein-tyrosine-phosphatase [Cumulibacter manganitolerans]